jgi:hypothetical protein
MTIRIFSCYYNNQKRVRSLTKQTLLAIYFGNFLFLDMAGALNRAPTHSDKPR